MQINAQMNSVQPQAAFKGTVDKAVIQKIKTIETETIARQISQANSNGIAVNPKIIESSLKKAALSGGEGCLSVNKDHKGLVHRNYKIKMKAFNALTNEEIVLTATGYLAIVLQHEYDHLDGKFFYDRLDTNKPFTPINGEEII